METLECLPRSSIPKATVSEISALYHAHPETLLDAIRNSDDRSLTILVIGHNPGIQRLAMDLSGNSDDALQRRLAEKFPTAALAVFKIDAESWQLVGPESAALIAFMTPRELPD